MTINRVFYTVLFLIFSITTHAAPYQLGYCNVTQVATGPKNECVPVRGKEASGVYPGTQHNDCTAAKTNARVNLLTDIPAACGAYIECGKPCTTIQK